VVTSKEDGQHIAVHTLSNGNAFSTCWSKMKMKAWSNAGVCVELRQQEDALEMNIDNMFV